MKTSELEKKLVSQQRQIDALKKELTAAQAKAIEYRNEYKRLADLLYQAGLGTFI